MPHQSLNFEIHCVDHCNRACRQCNHFTPYAQAFNGAKEYQADVYFPYIDRLVTIGRSPQTIQVIGGEPFIHSDLRGFVLGLKQRYGVAIKVSTNGFWLDEIERHVKILEEIDSLVVSLYPDEVDGKGKAPDWTFRVNELRRRFPNLPVTLKNIDTMYVADFVDWPLPMPRDCFALGCPCLRPDGKLYRCSTAGYAEWSPSVTKQFMELRSEMVLDLNRDDLNVSKWVNQGCTEVCRYCTVPQDVRVKTCSDHSFFLRLREAHRGRRANPHSILREWNG